MPTTSPSSPGPGAVLDESHGADEQDTMPRSVDSIQFQEVQEETQTLPSGTCSKIVSLQVQRYWTVCSVHRPSRMQHRDFDKVILAG